jgi:hypothetical protein
MAATTAVQSITTHGIIAVAITTATAKTGVAEKKPATTDATAANMITTDATIIATATTVVAVAAKSTTIAVEVINLHCFT